jgi:hypothetical protein
MRATVLFVVEACMLRLCLVTQLLLLVMRCNWFSEGLQHAY